MSSEQNVASPSPQSFHRDLENARVLIEDSPWRDTQQKYRKTAEAILRRILAFDPQNETAKLLLARAEEPVPGLDPAKPAPPARPVMQAAPPSPRPAPQTPVAAQAPRPRSREDLS